MTLFEEINGLSVYSENAIDPTSFDRIVIFYHIKPSGEKQYFQCKLHTAVQTDTKYEDSGMQERAAAEALFVIRKGLEYEIENYLL
jgi:hypothetical protein